MRANRRAFVFHTALGAIVALVLLGCFGGGGGGPAPGDAGDASPDLALDLPPGAQTLEGLVETDRFTIAAGETVYVTGDLTVRADQTIEIAGTLQASHDGGQRIELSAGGDLTIDGTVRAGHGGAEQPGGAVALSSVSGDVRLGPASQVAAGDGAPGVVDAERDTDGAGFAGGDVLVHAPEGALRLADGAVLVIGNGGAGADVAVRPEDAPADLPVWVLQNRGGDSGRLELDAGTLEGLETELLVIEADVLDEGGRVVLSAGETFTVLNATDHLAGGAGGDAGGFEYGPDVEGPSHVSEAALTGVSEKRHDVGVYDRDVRGAPGGNGMLRPGNGQSVTVSGNDGASPGQDGEDVRVFGGRGGFCKEPLTYHLCISGDGGSAYAEGGDGAPGLAPDGTGGHGGAAYARGGSIFPMFEVLGVGFCGNARAAAGAGGKGGGDCNRPDTLGPNGGTGGDGGNASASTCALDREGSRGVTGAYGGFAGRGGDALEDPGGPGLPGHSFEDSEPAIEGLSGVNGTRCSGAQAVDVSGYWLLWYSTRSAEDCGVTDVGGSYTPTRYLFYPNGALSQWHEDGFGRQLPENYCYKEPLQNGYSDWDGTVGTRWQGISGTWTAGELALRLDFCLLEQGDEDSGHLGVGAAAPSLDLTWSALRGHYEGAVEVDWGDGTSTTYHHCLRPADPSPVNFSGTCVRSAQCEYWSVPACDGGLASPPYVDNCPRCCERSVCVDGVCSEPSCTNHAHITPVCF